MTPPCTILYAEDEDNDVFFLKHAFEEAHSPHTINAVSDGKQALEYLLGEGPYADRARYPLPALIVLDINMPKKSGIEVLQWIREQPRFKSLPVVIFTSSSRTEDRDNAHLLGAEDYLLKPSNPLNLVEIVRSLQVRLLPQ